MVLEGWKVGIDGFCMLLIDKYVDKFVFVGWIGVWCFFLVKVYKMI